MNEYIRVPEVRVIGPNGSQIGILETKKALELARKHGLDLVEIAPSARPPVCKILDYGKFKYEQSKKTKDNKSTSAKVKEVKFRLTIGEHDYMTKLRHAEAFLFKGNKLKMTLTFRGREMEHRDLGFENIRKAAADLAQVGHMDGEPRMAGRNLILMMSPLPENKRKLVLNRSIEEVEAHPQEAEDDHDDDEDEDDEEEMDHS